MIAQTNKRLGVSMGKAEVPCHKTLLRNYIDWKKQSTLKRSFVWEGFFMVFGSLIFGMRAMAFISLGRWLVSSQ